MAINLWTNVRNASGTGGTGGSQTPRERLAALLEQLPEEGYYARIHGAAKTLHLAPAEAARYIARGERVEIYKDGGPKTERGSWLPRNTWGTPPGDELVVSFSGNLFFHADDAQLEDVGRQLRDHLASRK